MITLPQLALCVVSFAERALLIDELYWYLML